MENVHGIRDADGKVLTAEEMLQLQIAVRSVMRDLEKEEARNDEDRAANDTVRGSAD